MKDFIKHCSELEIYLSHLNVALKTFERTNGNRDYSKELAMFKEALEKVQSNPEFNKGDK